MPSTTWGVRSLTTPNTLPTLFFSLIAVVMPATAVPSHEKMMLISGWAVSIWAATSAVFAGSALSNAVATTATFAGRSFLNALMIVSPMPPAALVMIPTFCCPGRFAMLAATWAPCVG